jgi:hypothetical protein
MHAYSEADRQCVIDFRRACITVENSNDYPTVLDLYELLDVSLAGQAVRTTLWEDSSGKLIAYAIVETAIPGTSSENAAAQSVSASAGFHIRARPGGHLGKYCVGRRLLLQYSHTANADPDRALGRHELEYSFQSERGKRCLS